MNDAKAYARVRALFDAVAELPADAREQRLQTCGEDAAVVARVRSMLVVSGATAEFAAPVAAMLGSLASAEMAAGTRLGAWTLDRKIGEGGMGTVYAARRSDGHFEQSAAIKMLRGVPSAAALDFLARERQILAGLTHPNIARLLDGGTTPQGQPYLVMEFLDGVPIDRHCRDQRPNPATLLRLLIPVCEAVAYAHARLVVHCDLKPSNILVRTDGRPCLLDFGIARVLGDADRAQPSSISRRARAFTPGFASPEQEAGGVVNTASDVYSLGRLIEYLTECAGIAVDRELRAVIARATATAAAARYDSAATLAQEMHRYLDRQPLAALPATFAYRARKLLQRRWPAVLAATLFALTVATFTWRLAVDRDRALAAERQALAERDRANQAQAASKQISDFLLSMLDGANPDAGTGEIPTSKLVEQALTRIDSELAGQPAVQAELYGALAGVQDVLGNPKLALASYQKAIALERGLNRPLVLAQQLQKLAQLQRRSGSMEAAEAPAREALALYRANAPGDSLAPAIAARTLGAILSQVEGKAAEAESVLRQALASAASVDPTGLELARTQAELAGHLTRAGALEEAEQLLRSALELAKAQPEGTTDALGIKEQLGALLGKQRHFEDAEALLREALAQRRALHGDDDVSIPWRLSELANLLTNSGKPLQALPLFREALSVAAPKMGVDSIPYAILLNNLAIASMRVGDYTGSERAFRQALTIVAGPWGERAEGLANMRFNLATLLAKTDPAQALPLAGACEAVFAASYPADNAEVIDSRILLAVIRARLGHVQQARDWLRKVDDANADLKPNKRADRNYAQALIEIADGNSDAALASLTGAEALRDEALGAGDPRVWLAKIDRAELLAKRAGAGDHKASADLAREIFAHLDTTLVPDSPVRARIAKLL